MIEVKCPKCQKVIKVRDEDRGKRGKCGCGTAIEIPALSNQKNIETVPLASIAKAQVQENTSIQASAGKLQSSASTKLRSIGNMRSFAKAVGYLMVLGCILWFVMAIASNDTSFAIVGLYSVGTCLGGLLIVSMVCLLADIAEEMVRARLNSLRE